MRRGMAHAEGEEKEDWGTQEKCTVGAGLGRGLHLLLVRDLRQIDPQAASQSQTQRTRTPILARRVQEVLHLQTA